MRSSPRPTRIAESWARRTHLTVVAGLGFLFVIQVVDIVGGHWIIPTVIAIVAAVGLTVAYDRIEPVRSVASGAGSHTTPVRLALSLRVANE